MRGHFTRKGLELSAKLAAGATLVITRVVAGCGDSGEPDTAEALAQPKQELAVNDARYNETTAIIPATLVSSMAEEDYSLTEIGVFAQDPDLGEILYKIYQLDQPINISPAAQIVLRFYLEESVSEAPVIEIPASLNGLLTQSDMGIANGVAGLDENALLPVQYGGTGAANINEARKVLGILVFENVTSGSSITFSLKDCSTYLFTCANNLHNGAILVQTSNNSIYTTKDLIAPTGWTLSYSTSSLTATVSETTGRSGSWVSVATVGNRNAGPYVGG